MIASTISTITVVLTGLPAVADHLAMRTEPAARRVFLLKLILSN
jgi:hypothetical protein